MTLRHQLYMLILMATVTATAPRLAAQSSPGSDILKRMHDKYANSWYKTLTFTQTTTIAGRVGAPPRIETWYESLQFVPNGAWLRIDQGDLAAGNGTMYTADSSWSVRAGKPGAGNTNGNPFIPLIENVYLQPVAATIRQMEPLHIDMSRVTDVKWEGRAAWSVGATSASDTLSPQFWIDKERLVVVRMMLALVPNRPPYDIQLGEYVETGGGWLATKVVMLVGGVARQTEEYHDWKTKVSLDPKLFDVNAWSTARHWAKGP